MKIYVKWISYSPSNSVKIKLPIEETVEYDERTLTKLLNSNLRRIYDLSPTGFDNPDLICLETNGGKEIKF